MFKFIIYTLLLSVFSFNLVYADIISKIKINGNNRLTEESIIVFGDIKLNSNIDSKNLDLILKKLYATIFFSSIDFLFTLFL